MLQSLSTDKILPLISDSERVFVRKGCICSVHELHERSVEDLLMSRQLSDREVSFPAAFQIALFLAVLFVFPRSCSYQACCMMVHVCEALHSLSQLGVRHRNIRLSHIFMNPEGSFVLGGFHFAISIQGLFASVFLLCVFCCCFLLCITMSSFARI
jgi:serine/threonine protein kinase